MSSRRAPRYLNSQSAASFGGGSVWDPFGPCTFASWVRSTAIKNRNRVIDYSRKILNTPWSLRRIPGILQIGFFGLTLRTLVNQFYTCLLVKPDAKASWAFSAGLRYGFCRWSTNHFFKNPVAFFGCFALLFRAFIDPSLSSLSTCLRSLLRFGETSASLNLLWTLLRTEGSSFSWLPSKWIYSWGPWFWDVFWEWPTTIQWESDLFLPKNISPLPWNYNFDLLFYSVKETPLSICAGYRVLQCVLSVKSTLHGEWGPVIFWLCQGLLHILLHLFKIAEY